jgi:hypothetical protein
MRRNTIVVVLLAAALLAPTVASSQEPPASPPNEWGPMSINLEDVPYPHPVSYYSFTLEGRTCAWRTWTCRRSPPRTGRA